MLNRLNNYDSNRTQSNTDINVRSDYNIMDQYSNTNRNNLGNSSGNTDAITLNQNDSSSSFHTKVKIMGLNVCGFRSKVINTLFESLQVNMRYYVCLRPKQIILI